MGSKIRVLIKEYKNNYFNILNIKIPGFLYIYKTGLYSTYFPRFETFKIPNMK
jgi:hypothetical protein